jgi:hypothetical protein
MDTAPPTPAPRKTSTAVIVGVTLLGVVVIGGLFLVFFGGIVAAIAVPNFIMMQLKAKRSEVPANVDGIMTAELSYDAAFDTFVPAGSKAQALRSLSKEQHTFESDAGFQTIGWQPDGLVRGGYWVELHGDSFVVHGIIDADGDGEYAEYVADGGPARLVTGPNVY